jgi:hypothetical protein
MVLVYTEPPYKLQARCCAHYNFKRAGEAVERLFSLHASLPSLCALDRTAFSLSYNNGYFQIFTRTMDQQGVGKFRLLDNLVVQIHRVRIR